jgi:hypothetical protein
MHRLDIQVTRSPERERSIEVKVAQGDLFEVRALNKVIVWNNCIGHRYPLGGDKFKSIWSSSFQIARRTKIDGSANGPERLERRGTQSLIEYATSTIVLYHRIGVLKGPRSEAHRTTDCLIFLLGAASSNVDFADMRQELSTLVAGPSEQVACLK